MADCCVLSSLNTPLSVTVFFREVITCLQTVQYIQPQHHAQLGQAELLVIDEAAAIPLPLVKSMLGPYLVFLCSTVNGYEGTGRSLSLKLLQQLRAEVRVAHLNSTGNTGSLGPVPAMHSRPGSAAQMGTRLGGPFVVDASQGCQQLLASGQCHCLPACLVQFCWQKYQAAPCLRAPTAVLELKFDACDEITSGWQASRVCMLPGSQGYLQRKVANPWCCRARSCHQDRGKRHPQLLATALSGRCSSRSPSGESHVAGAIQRRVAVR